jgi:hypothetical protein
MLYYVLRKKIVKMVLNFSKLNFRPRVGLNIVYIKGVLCTCQYVLYFKY